MIDSKSELVSGYRYPIRNCSMEVTIGSVSHAVTPIDRNGFCIRFDSAKPLDVGKQVTYTLTDNETGESASGLSITIVTVDTLSESLHRVGAIYSD
jgi:hypothetical protein